MDSFEGIERAKPYRYNDRRTWDIFHVWQDGVVRDGVRFRQLGQVDGATGGRVLLAPHGEILGRLSDGVWINNMRYAQAHGRMRTEWVEKLEAAPGWTWRSGDEIALMANFARREGHTDVPLDHREAGHPLGQWAQGRRTAYAKGWLHPDDVRRTEGIPRWRW